MTESPPAARSRLGPSSLSIRPETPADAAAIGALISAAFVDEPHSDGGEPRIVEALRRAGTLALSLVAEQDGTPCGHVAFSPVEIGDAAGWYGLGPLAVAPALQQCGIGSALVRAGLVALRERGAAGCVVLGEPGYYARFGFRPEAGCVLPGVPPAYFQVLTFAGPAPQGTVHYQPAFNGG